MAYMAHNEDIIKLQLDSKIWSGCIKELEGYLGKEIRSFDDEYKQVSDLCEKEEISLYESQNEDEVINYYSRTKKYLFELLRWEATYDKQENFKRIKLFLQQNKLNRVLDSEFFSEFDLMRVA